MLKQKYEPGSLESMKSGIIWREKLDYGKTIIGFLSTWIAAEFVLQVFHHPGFILGFGVLYAVVIGAKAGGNEATDGAEEFSFSLAPSRSLRYKVKYLYGLKPLLLLLSLGLVTIYFDLSQRLWSLFVESGLNNSYSIYGKTEIFWYLLSFFLPLTVYTVVFGMAIITKSRNSVNGSVFGALIICGLLVVSIAILYNKVGSLSTNILSVSVLIFTIILSIYFTYTIYRVKEGRSISRTSASGRSGLVVVVFIILVVLVIFTLFFRVDSKVNAIDSSRPDSIDEVERDEAVQQLKIKGDK